jgi:hypothetical protein
MLGWLVDERGIDPHIPMFDKSERTDGTFSRADFIYDRKTPSISALPESCCENIVAFSLRHAAA